MKKQGYQIPIHSQHDLISELFQLRNQFSRAITVQKKGLLQKINVEQIKTKTLSESLYHTLLFITAYADNDTIYNLAATQLNSLTDFIKANVTQQTKLYNSGVTGSLVCAQFSFEMVQWLRKKYTSDVQLDSIAADDARVLYIVSAVLPQVESEILQDENLGWKQLLQQCTPKGDDLLDTLLNLFDQSHIRPEVKDELWNSLAIYIVVRLTEQTQLSHRLTARYYHQSLIKKVSLNDEANYKPVKIKLTVTEAEELMECGRMILIRHSRELDPISFCESESVSYYQLQRGMSIALFGMRTARRHPIDCYMGYVVFKNGLPVSYGGSWILFDSARIAFNVFPSYRGGESQAIFRQILKLHQYVYRLNRFSVDPYQIGKHNSDGIKSGSFYTYYKFGFKPMRDELAQLAASEAIKIQSLKGYRSSTTVLKKLANGRLELMLNKKAAVRFDATDLSLVYQGIIKVNYAGNRKTAEQDAYQRLKTRLQLPSLIDDETLQYVIKNWCVILMADSAQLKSDNKLIVELRKLFMLKANGNEEEYIRLLQSCKPLRKLVEAALANSSLNPAVPVHHSYLILIQ